MSEEQNFTVMMVCTYHLLTTNEAQMKKSFDDADLDKSGAIDAKELNKCLKSAYLHLSHDVDAIQDPEFKDKMKEMVEYALEKYDSDKNGTIEYNEYKALFATLTGQNLLSQLEKRGIPKPKVVEYLTPLKTSILDHYTTKKIGIKSLDLYKTLNKFLELASQ